MLEPKIRFKKTDGTSYPELSKKIIADVVRERHVLQTISEESPQLSFTIEEGVIYPENRKTNKRDFLIKDKDNKKFALTELDDIIYNPSNIIHGAIHRNKLCRGLVSPIYAIFEPLIDAGYIETYVRRQTFILKLVKYLEGTVIKLRTLKAEDFLKLPIYVPCEDEQKRITEFFSNIDDLIKVSEKEVHKLEKIKKAMLQKMFPKEGFDVPEIRFGSYSNSWKKVKLSEVLEPVVEKNTLGKYTKQDILAASLGSELEPKTIFFGLKSTDDSIFKYIIVRDGYIIFTKSPIKGFPNGIVRASKGVEGIVPSLYCVYKKKKEINSSYIQAFMEEKSRLDKYLNPLVNVGARNNVNITSAGFLEGEILVPDSIEEQNDIVELLENINDAIKYAKKELEKYKELKQGLLQQMFI